MNVTGFRIITPKRPALRGRGWVSAPRCGAEAPARFTRAGDWDAVGGELADYAPQIIRLSAEDRTTLDGGRLAEEVHAEVARLPGRERQQYLRAAMAEDAPSMPE